MNLLIKFNSSATSPTSYSLKFETDRGNATWPASSAIFKVGICDAIRLLNDMTQLQWCRPIHILLPVLLSRTYVKHAYIHMHNIDIHVYKHRHNCTVTYKI